VSAPDLALPRLGVVFGLQLAVTIGILVAQLINYGTQAGGAGRLGRAGRGGEGGGRRMGTCRPAGWAGSARGMGAGWAHVLCLLVASGCVSCACVSVLLLQLRSHKTPKRQQPRPRPRPLRRPAAPPAPRPAAAPQDLRPFGWRISLACGAAPALLLTFGALALPDTPNSLVLRGRREAGRRVLQRVRGTQHVDVEFDDIVEAVRVASLVKNPYRTIVSSPRRAALRFAWGGGGGVCGGWGGVW
jgi:hypothetical protein